MKTLKDIQISEFIREQLKKSAIEDIKQYEISEEQGKDTSGIIAYIKYKFNIKEEDLK